MNANVTSGSRGATWREFSPPGRFSWWRLAGALLVLYLLLALLFGWFWSRELTPFDVRARATELVGERMHLSGVAMTAAHIGVTEALLHKRGGYLRNDRLPPGVWLDNIPSWEYGVLLQVRDMSIALRDTFGRPRPGSPPHDDLAEAVTHFAADSTRWSLPAPEREYQRGLDRTRSYLERLVDNEGVAASFDAQPRRLDSWLQGVEERLAGLSTRLSASAGTWIDPQDWPDERADQQAVELGQVFVKTPRLKIDDIFYEARGSAWALLHYLRAVEDDFAEVLRRRGGWTSLRQAIRELEATQKNMRSPIIFNGSGFGLLPNHSLVMASHVGRAHMAIAELREALVASDDASSSRVTQPSS